MRLLSLPLSAQTATTTTTTTPRGALLARSFTAAGCSRKGREGEGGVGVRLIDPRRATPRRLQCAATNGADVDTYAGFEALPRGCGLFVLLTVLSKVTLKNGDVFWQLQRIFRALRILEWLGAAEAVEEQWRRRWRRRHLLGGVLRQLRRYAVAVDVAAAAVTDRSRRDGANHVCTEKERRMTRKASMMSLTNA